MYLLRINMKERSVRRETLSGDALLIGGRALIARILGSEVPPEAEPFSPDNKIIMTNGALAGTGITSSGRLSIGGKSPLTGGIKESNAGGVMGDTLAKLGCRAIIFEDRAEDNAKYLLVVDEKGEVSFEDASDLLGLGNYACAEKLQARFGKNSALLTLGQAAEFRMLSSAIAITDMYGRPSRMAARGGLGAVLCDKGVKAMVVSRRGAYKNERVSCEAFRAARAKLNDTVRDSPRVTVLREYGTSSTFAPMQAVGALPTCNFKYGHLDEGDCISGESMHDLINARGGGTNTEGCMAGCLVKCSNAFPNAEGKEIVAPVEYETLVLMGSNLGLRSLDQIAELNYIANDAGVDSIEIGGALGVMAENGSLVTFGDYEGFRRIMEGVKTGTPEGRIAGSGAFRAGETLGVRRVPTVKKQTLSAYDPRVIKGTGVTFATCPMGADHTAGLTIFFPGDHSKKENQVEYSRRAQFQRMGYDCLGMCAFLTSALGMTPQIITDCVQALYDVPFTPDDWTALSKDTLHREVAFNRAAGLGPETDTLPEFFKTEPALPSGARWDISDEEMAPDTLFA